MKSLILLAVILTSGSINATEKVISPEKKRAMFMKKCMFGVNDGDDDKSHIAYVEQMQNCQLKYDALLKTESASKHRKSKK